MYDDEINEGRYVVTIGSEGGYMPDEVAIFDTLAECYSFAKDWKANIRMNAAWGDYAVHITGNIRTDRMYIVDDGRSLNTILTIDVNPNR